VKYASNMYQQILKAQEKKNTEELKKLKKEFEDDRKYKSCEVSFLDSLSILKFVFRASSGAFLFSNTSTWSSIGVLQYPLLSNDCAP
jgi:hypothetical protein